MEGEYGKGEPAPGKAGGTHMRPVLTGENCRGGTMEGPNPNSRKGCPSK